MTNEELASKVVSILSAYLVRREQAGPSAYNIGLDALLALVEARLSDLYDAETFARFINTPRDATEARTLHARLERILTDDGSFRQQVVTAIGNPDMTVPSRPKKTGRRAAIIGVGAVAVLAAVFLIGRATTSPAPTPAAGGTPVHLPTNTPAVTPSESSSLPTTTTSAPSESPSVPNNPGDGSSLSADTPVFLVDLPIPNDSWVYQHGSHDVQLTQYQYAVWTTVSTCSGSSYLSVEQQFRLKNFKRFGVKAVGTDSTSDPALAVKFEVFVNNDKVNPISSVVANPGESKPIDVALPENVFSLTLRTSVNTVDKSTCHKGNGVWGYPYVTAAGS